MKCASEIYDVFTDVRTLITELNSDFEQYYRNFTPSTVLSPYTEQTSIFDLTDEHITFMWYQLVIDILLHSSEESNGKNEMLNVCRIHYRTNETYLGKIDEFERTYKKEDAISWHTKDSFLYKVINLALQKQSINIIYKFRLFLKDLYDQLCKLHKIYRQILLCDKSDTLNVFRTQWIATDEVKKCQTNIGGLTATTTFLSTSFSSEAALLFIAGYEEPIGRSDNTPVLFDIDIGTTTAKPFAYLHQNLNSETEKELLLSIESTFRTESVEIINDEVLTVIKLIACSSDEDFNLKNSKQNFKKILGIDRRHQDMKWGYLLFVIGEYKLAEQHYKILLAKLTENDLN
ncbi:unnamed protein product [Didymodactylos carnosus]|uniref:Uncharacterized protein n=2 Tax=Didymodactylos carnosus TaxID=1234261 RepID=A0A815ZHY1_9BILA|nr:unnamed protein product [Didymodactylos carnosus]CAF4454220.1 unnamed protein product [Didymodactylos carnosus]